MRRKFRIAAAAFAALTTVAALAGCGGSSATSSATSSETTLQLWMSGDCKADGSCLNRQLAEAFTKANPSIKIDIISQPTDSYQTSLQAASVTGRGPDLATVFGGSYLTQIAKYTADAKKWVAQKDLESSVGAEFFAENSNIANRLYAVPVDSQWYSGFYNKKILAANGFDSPPQNWDELYAMCEKLKANGVLPIVEGKQDSSAQFQPLYEWSYLAAALPLTDWNGLYNGTMPYDNPTLQSQLDKWHGLFAKGYINKDAFNNPDTLDQFYSGKAAMMLGGGSWLVPDMEKKMGADVGVLAPPYLDSGKKSIVQFAGAGIAAMQYGKHLDEAGKFLAFVLSNDGQKVIADSGVPGSRPGSAPKGSALFDTLVNLSTQPGTTTYPMFDNLSQGPVTDVIYRTAAQVLVGQTSSQDALKAMDAAVKALPAEQRNIDYKLGS